MQNIDILNFFGFCIEFHSKLLLPNDQYSVNTSAPMSLHQYRLLLVDLTSSNGQILKLREILYVVIIT